MNRVEEPRREGWAPLSAQTEGQGQRQAHGAECCGQLTVRKDTGQEGSLPLQSGLSKSAQGRYWDSEAPLVGKFFFAA